MDIHKYFGPPTLCTIIGGQDGTYTGDEKLSDLQTHFLEPEELERAALEL